MDEFEESEGDGRRGAAGEGVEDGVQEMEVGVLEVETGSGGAAEELAEVVCVGDTTGEEEKKLLGVRIRLWNGRDGSEEKILGIVTLGFRR